VPAVGKKENERDTECSFLDWAAVKVFSRELLLSNVHITKHSNVSQLPLASKICSFLTMRGVEDNILF